MPEQVAHMLAERFVAFRDREKSLVAELRTYKAVFDVTPCPMLLATADGLVAYANPSVCVLLNTALPNLAVEGWFSYVADADAPRLKEQWAWIVKDKIPYFSATVTLKADKGPLTIVWRATRLPDGGFTVAMLHPDCALSKLAVEAAARCACDTDLSSGV